MELITAVVGMVQVDSSVACSVVSVEVAEAEAFCKVSSAGWAAAVASAAVFWAVASAAVASAAVFWAVVARALAARGEVSFRVSSEPSVDVASSCLHNKSKPSNKKSKRPVSTTD
jgi:hypothetical protein